MSTIRGRLNDFAAKAQQAIEASPTAAAAAAKARQVSAAAQSAVDAGASAAADVEKRGTSLKKQTGRYTLGQASTVENALRVGLAGEKAKAAASAAVNAAASAWSKKSGADGTDFE